MLSDGNLSPWCVRVRLVCHLSSGQRSERLCFCRSRPTSPIPHPPTPLEKAKGNFETQRLGTLPLVLVGMMQATVYMFLPLPFWPMEASIGWLQPLRLGLHSSRGSRGTDTGEGGHGLYFVHTYE